MSRNDFIRYNNQDWTQVTQTAPKYDELPDLNMVEFEPTKDADFRELMFRKAIGLGMSYGKAREYADAMTTRRNA